MTESGIWKFYQIYLSSDDCNFISFGTFGPGRDRRLLFFDEKGSRGFIFEREKFMWFPKKVHVVLFLKNS